MSKIKGLIALKFFKKVSFEVIVDSLAVIRNNTREFHALIIHFSLSVDILDCSTISHPGNCH